MVESKKNRITEVSDFLVICRGEGIRTLDRLAPIPAFQAGPFNHSGTPLKVFAKIVLGKLLHKHSLIALESVLITLYLTQ